MIKTVFISFMLLTVTSHCRNKRVVCYDLCYMSEEGNKKYNCEIISENGCVAKLTNKETGEVTIIDENKKPSK